MEIKGYILEKTIRKPLNSRKPLETVHSKYIDDFSVAESLNLKEKLVHKKDKVFLYPTKFGHYFGGGRTSAYAILERSGALLTPQCRLAR